MLQEALYLKNRGNIKFKNQEHEEASKLYTEALRTCPLLYQNYRAILFANRAAAKSNIVSFIISNIIPYYSYFYVIY